MKQTAILTVKLFLITAIVAAILGGVNMVTAPIIAQNAEKTFNEAMKEVLPEAKEFQKVEQFDFTPSESGVKVESLYTAGAEGYVVSAVCAEGFGGDVSVMVGIDSNYNVTKAKIMEMAETPGLGMKASEPAFIDQYEGLGAGVQVDKNGSAGNAEYKVEAISGATITSKAVTKAVNAALEAAETVKGGD